jgi:ribosomal protein L21E
MNFKIGDLVKIRTDLTDEDKHQHPDFVGSMEKTQGRIGRIIGITDSISYDICIEGDMNSWLYNKTWILPYADPIKMLKELIE